MDNSCTAWAIYSAPERILHRHVKFVICVVVTVTVTRIAKPLPDLTKPPPVFTIKDTAAQFTSTESDAVLFKIHVATGVILHVPELFFLRVLPSVVFTSWWKRIRGGGGRGGCGLFASLASVAVFVEMTVTIRFRFEFPVVPVDRIILLIYLTVLCNRKIVMCWRFSNLLPILLNRNLTIIQKYYFLRGPISTPVSRQLSNTFQSVKPWKITNHLSFSRFSSC